MNILPLFCLDSLALNPSSIDPSAADYLTLQIRDTNMEMACSLLG